MTKHLTHAQLDAKLDALAKQALAAFAAGRADTFVPAARELVAKLDKRGTALEVSDPQSWRRPVKSPSSGQRLALSQQFRAEVDSIVPLDRDAEQLLARRIEFARLRLERALEETGVAPERLPKGVASPGFGLQSAVGATAGCTLPARVCRRWFELHALRSEMVERNLWLVGVNVERYSHTSASQADLIQEGSAALFRAVDGFDWRRGLLFRTYAVHWLNQAFRSYLYNFSNTVRVPVYLQKALKHVNDAKASLGDQNAAASAIAGQAGMDEHLVESALGAVRSMCSLDATYDDDDGGRLRDFLSAPESEEGPYCSSLEDHTLSGRLEDALAGLSERERFVIERRFGINQPREFTLAEVAHELKVSLERVRQIQVRALGKLRTPNLRRVIDPFLN
ncbi:MAG: sigma-70 family RNA polymerase sigma factor [Planctomycetes bacterium]|nr:sigma-70 family RNA polymerase sigma factor [Planctomycetota bacterium]